MRPDQLTGMFNKLARRNLLVLVIFGAMNQAKPRPSRVCQATRRPVSPSRVCQAVCAFVSLSVGLSVNKQVSKQLASEQVSE